MNEQVLTNRPLPGARLNMSHPLAKDILTCYMLNENGGIRALDLSPYSLHGLVVGAKTSANGRIFNGTSDYIDCTTNPRFDFTTTPFSIEAWGITNNLTAINAIAGRGEAMATGYLFRVEINGAIGFYTRQAGATQTTTSAAGSVVTGRLYHLAVVRNGVSARVYRDGIDVTTTAGSHIDPLTNTRKMLIGAYDNISSFWVGTLGLVRIWRRGLFPSEVKQLYLSPYSPMGTPLFI